MTMRGRTYYEVNDDNDNDKDEDTEDDKGVAAEGMWKHWASTYANQLCSHLRTDSANGCLVAILSTSQSTGQ